MLMDSLDKLRDYASRYHRVTGQMTEMSRIADEIEAEIAEHYTKLPVDADGVPIRVGDKIEHRGHTGDVWLFGANEIMCTDRVCYPIGECHLAKPRTLEDVLREFASKKIRIHCEFKGYSTSADDDVIAKYAAEIRELMGGDAE